MHQKPPLKELTLKSQPESETMPNKSDITDKADQSRVLLKVIPSTEEAAPAETTDQESKVEEEETLVTSETNSTEINTKNPHNKSLLPPQLNKSLKNKNNLRNPKNQLLPSTIKARALKSTPLSKKKSQSEDKSMLIGSRRRS